MKIVFLLCLFILQQAWCLRTTQADEDCDGDDVDAIVLSGLQIYESASAMVAINVSTVVEVRTRVEATIHELHYDDLKVADSEADNPGNAAEASSGGSAEFARAVYSYYYDVCPAIWYRVYFWRWYFWNSGSYCWPINSLWLPKCVCNYCKLRPYYYDTWSSHLQCVLEYSWTYIPSVCYSRQTGRWTKEYLRRYLPRGCCCKSYWRYGLVQKQQCEVESSGGL